MPIEKIPEKNVLHGDKMYEIMWSTQPLSRRKVLCVDDDKAILSSLRRLLHNEFYTIVTTNNPYEAVHHAKKENVNLVITDQRMPGMNGTEVVRAIAKNNPKTRFIILSGYPDDLDILYNAKMIHRLVPKPWDDKELKRTVVELLQKREYGE